MNSLVHTGVEDRDFLRTVEALLEESEDDRTALELELRRKEAEIEEKQELISCLKGEKPRKKKNKEKTSISNSEKTIKEIEMKLNEKIGELGEIQSNIQYYSNKISNIEEKAAKIASLGDKAVIVLKKQIEKLNRELRLREEVISELRVKEDIHKIVNKELSNKIKKSSVGESGE